MYLKVNRLYQLFVVRLTQNVSGELGKFFQYNYVQLV